MSCKGWVDFVGGNIPEIKDSFNVSEIERVGKGDYIVHWEVPFGNPNIQINSSEGMSAILEEISREKVRLKAAGRIAMIAYGDDDGKTNTP